jgi:hypothetical protein
MSEHPNVATVNRMTKAVFEQDADTLASVFKPDLEFHLRGPVANAGDHSGVAGFLDTVAAVVEATDGDI